MSVFFLLVEKYLAIRLLWDPQGFAFTKKSLGKENEPRVSPICCVQQ